MSSNQWWQWPNYLKGAIIHPSPLQSPKSFHHTIEASSIRAASVNPWNDCKTKRSGQTKRQQASRSKSTTKSSQNFSERMEGGRQITNELLPHPHATVSSEDRPRSYHQLPGFRASARARDMKYSLSFRALFLHPACDRVSVGAFVCIPVCLCWFVAWQHHLALLPHPASPPPPRSCNQTREAVCTDTS